MQALIRANNLIASASIPIPITVSVSVTNKVRPTVEPFGSRSNFCSMPRMRWANTCMTSDNSSSELATARSAQRENWYQLLATPPDPRSLEDSPSHVPPKKIKVSLFGVRFCAASPICSECPFKHMDRSRTKHLLQRATATFHWTSAGMVEHTLHQQLVRQIPRVAKSSAH